MCHLLTLLSVQVLSTEEVPSRTSSRKMDGSLFDGSYLSLQVQRNSDEGRAAVQTCSNPVSLSCAPALCSTHGQTKPHRSDKRKCSEAHSESCQRCEQCQVQNSVCGTHQWRGCNGPHPENGHQDTFDKYNCERYSNTQLLLLYFNVYFPVVFLVVFYQDKEEECYNIK